MRQAILEKSTLPICVLPGDNDINDCEELQHGKARGGGNIIISRVNYGIMSSNSRDGEIWKSLSYSAY